MVSAQQASEDTDGCLKEVHVHVLAEGELFLHPVLCICKLYVEWGRVQEWEGKDSKKDYIWIHLSDIVDKGYWCFALGGMIKWSCSSPETASDQGFVTILKEYNTADTIWYDKHSYHTLHMEVLEL